MPIPIDMYESHGKLIVVAPIAGITIEHISVTVTDDLLTIQGIREIPEKISPGNYFSEECFWGEFSRSVVLPVKVNTNEVTAFYKRGILRIEIPLQEKKSLRVIPIKS